MGTMVRFVHVRYLIPTAALMFALFADIPLCNVAHADHFRYGTLSWRPTEVPGQVMFKLIVGLARQDQSYDPMGEGFFSAGVDEWPETGDVITVGSGLEIDFG